VRTDALQGAHARQSDLYLRLDLEDLMADEEIQSLQKAEDALRIDHIYRITFEACFEDEEGVQDWIYDDLDVGAGLDAEEAVNKVKAFVKTEDYGVKVVGFRLKQVKLLAHANLI
jgi:hypothetical protein